MPVSHSKKKEEGKRSKKQAGKKIYADEDCIMADVLVKNPEKIDEIKGKYLILCDHVSNAVFNNLNKALNLMALKGWRCINICALKDEINWGKMYALMEKT